MGQEPLDKMNDKLDDLTLGDFLEVLQDKGRYEEAEHYLFTFMLTAASQGMMPDELLSMTLDEFINVNRGPLRQGPPGWNTYWGKSIVQHNG